MALDTYPLGLSAKLYRNTGTYGSPTWNEIDQVKDVTLTMTNNEADVTTRAGGGFVLTLPTTTAIEVSFQMLSKTGDQDLDAIRTAFFAKTDLEFAVMSGPVTDTDSRGVRFTGRVYSFTRNEAIGDAQLFDVTIKPAPATNAPAWFSGSA